MSGSPLLQYVVPALVHRREPLADDQNALVSWRSANEAVIDSEEIAQLFFARADCNCGQAECLACNYEQSNVLTRLIEILRRNEYPLQLLQQCLFKGRMQFPRLCPVPWFGGSEWDNGYTLLQLKSLEAWSLAEQGDLEAAARSIRERMTIGAMVARGGGSCTFIEGVGYQRSSLASAKRLAARELSRQALGDLQEAARQYLEPGELLRAESVNFCELTLSLVEQMPQDANASDLVDLLLAQLYESAPILRVGADPWDDEGRLAQRREQLQFLLGGHPAPWNQVDTVRSLSELIVVSMPEECSDEIATSLTQVDDDRRIAMAAAWPNQLGPCFPIECFGDSASARQKRADYAGVRVEEEPLTASQLLKARDAVRSIDNPIGTLIEWANWPSHGEHSTYSLCRENFQAAWELDATVEQKLNPRLLARLKALLQTRRRGAPKRDATSWRSQQ
jgi:hypothetical protein